MIDEETIFMSTVYTGPNEGDSEGFYEALCELMEKHHIESVKAWKGFDPYEEE